MAITKDQVRKNAQSFVDSLMQLTPKERERNPEPRYAQELNRLIELAKEVAPELDPRLWPSPIDVRDTDFGMTVFARYEDFDTAARQIASHL